MARRSRHSPNEIWTWKGAHLREGIMLDAAMDASWTYRSPELYGLLVNRRD